MQNQKKPGKTACEADFTELLKDAVYLMCALGRQPCVLGEHAWSKIPDLFDEPGRFQRAVERNAGAVTSPPVS